MVFFKAFQEAAIKYLDIDILMFLSQLSHTPSAMADVVMDITA